MTIARGAPKTVINHPDVVAGYLGFVGRRDRAIREAEGGAAWPAQRPPTCSEEEPSRRKAARSR